MALTVTVISTHCVSATRSMTLFCVLRNKILSISLCRTSTASCVEKIDMAEPLRRSRCGGFHNFRNRTSIERRLYCTYYISLQAKIKHAGRFDDLCCIEMLVSAPGQPALRWWRQKVSFARKCKPAVTVMLLSRCMILSRLKFVLCVLDKGSGIRCNLFLKFLDGGLTRAFLCNADFRQDLDRKDDYPRCRAL
jgi:hypothetical protein